MLSCLVMAQGIRAFCAYSVTSTEQTAGSPFGVPVSRVTFTIGRGFSRCPMMYDCPLQSVTTKATCRVVGSSSRVLKRKVTCSILPLLLYEDSAVQVGTPQNAIGVMSVNMPTGIPARCLFIISRCRFPAGACPMNLIPGSDWVIFIFFVLCGSAWHLDFQNGVSRMMFNINYRLAGQPFVRRAIFACGRQNACAYRSWRWCSNWFPSPQCHELPSRPR